MATNLDEPLNIFAKALSKAIIALYTKEVTSETLYKRFKDSIQTRDNETIENTTVYKLLGQMLGADKSVFEKTLKKGTKFYRARIDKDSTHFSRKGDTIHGLNKYASKEPPIHVSSEGRNNIRGASYLYLSGDPYTACAEVRPLRDDYISIAKFSAKKDLLFFDVSDISDKYLEEAPFKKFSEKNKCSATYLIKSIIREFYSPVSDTDTGYLVCQYIADLIRKNGYDGLCHKSYITDGVVYTLFNCSENHIRFVSSDVAVVDYTSIHAWSINTGEDIENPNRPPAKDRATLKKDMLDRMQYNEEETNNG